MLPPLAPVSTTIITARSLSVRASQSRPVTTPTAPRMKFRNLLKKNIVKFRYKKKDGSVRTALGTLKKDMLPKYKTDKRPAYNPSRFVYWDTERDQFRSFLRANFMDLEDPKKARKEDAGNEDAEKEDGDGEE